jgi:hypothetical protein
MRFRNQRRAIYLLLARLLNMGEARQIWSTVRELLPSGNRGPL